MSSTVRARSKVGARLLAQIVAAYLFALLVMALLALFYALVPVPEEPWNAWAYVVYGTVMFLIFASVLVFAVFRLNRSPRPLAEGMAFIVISAAVLVLSYSWLYTNLSESSPDSFTQPLNKVAAVYFTVTVLATVGFGDITPVGDLPRLLVTSQMLLGFTVITLAIRMISTTTSNRIKRKVADHVATHPGTVVPQGLSESAADSPGQSNAS